MNILLVTPPNQCGAEVLTKWAHRRQYNVSLCYAFHSHFTPPNTAHFDLIIVMGMSLNIANLQTLSSEKAWLASLLKANKRLLGIGLGAQLLALSLGSQPVSKPQRGLGWHPIAINDEALASPVIRGFNLAMLAFHWTEQGFTLPKGALSLFSSPFGQNQGFLYQDRVLALYFHLEADERLISHFAKEKDKSNSQEPIVDELISQLDFYPSACYLHRMLDNWLALNTE